MVEPTYDENSWTEFLHLRAPFMGIEIKPRKWKKFKFVVFSFRGKPFTQLLGEGICLPVVGLCNAVSPSTVGEKYSFHIGTIKSFRNLLKRPQNRLFILKEL